MEEIAIMTFIASMIRTNLKYIQPSLRKLELLYAHVNHINALYILAANERAESTMPAVLPGGGAQGPSCFDRMKLGFMMGMGVGMASGFLFGGFGAWRVGLRGSELMTQVAKGMVQGGGTFGTFMAIGTGIRC